MAETTGGLLLSVEEVDTARERASASLTDNDGND